MTPNDNAQRPGPPSSGLDCTGKPLRPEEKEGKKPAEPHSGCASVMAGRDLAEVSCQQKPGTTIIIAMFNWPF